MTDSGKKLIRKEIIARLKGQDKERQWAKSRIIQDKLFACEVFIQARVVMFYVSKDEEVDTHRMIKKALDIGKRVVVPYSVSETNQIIASELENPELDLELGIYGIYQPKKSALREIPVESIDLVIVPGVAFDKKNYRLGRGRGYYDRFLRKLNPGAYTIGICFDLQLVGDLPKDSHDLPVSRVITN